MIPVKVIMPLYIRNGPGRDFDVMGVAPASGATIFMDGVKEDGQARKGVSKWYFKLNERNERQWYWGGRIEVQADATAVAVKNQGWITDLRLPEIWKMATGRNIGVAVIDTGIAFNNTELPFNKTVFNSFKNRNDINDLVDLFGHGTRCASIIGARNKNGKILGVAPDSNLHIYKISDTDNLNLPGLPFNENNALRYVDALNWCSSQQQIKIISISWSLALFNREVIDKLQQAVDNAIAKNKIIVAARGNHFSSTPDAGLFYPACLSGVISVGIIPKAPNFNYSGHIDVITHGIDIQTYTLQNSVAPDTGTSMATAIIAGIIALILQKRGSHTRANDIKQILKQVSLNADGNSSVLNGNLLSAFFLKQTI